MGSIAMNLTKRIHSPMRGATTAKSYAQPMTAGIRNLRNWPRSLYYVQAATSGPGSATLALLSRWMTLPICAGSAARAPNGIPGLASISGSIHPTTGRTIMKKRVRPSAFCPAGARSIKRRFLDEDYCAIEDRDFFVRGLIHLPIIGAAETFRWGVWGSLSRENFNTLLKLDGKEERVDLPHMFSWLSTKIPEYPDTLSLKMYAHIQGPGMRPHFFLEQSDHPLAQEYHNGITAERVKAIMLGRLGGNE